MHRQDLEESEKVFECNLPLWLVSSLVNFRLAWYIFALSHTFNRLIILLHSSEGAWARAPERSHERQLPGVGAREAGQIRGGGGNASTSAERGGEVSRARAPRHVRLPASATLGR